MPSLYLAPEVRRLALASQGWRGLVAVLALALGVALGYGVHRVHSAAVAETEGAARRLAGQADLVVRAVDGGMDEALYPRLATRPEVAAASPALELEAKVPAKADDRRRERLRILGLDIFRASELQPILAALPEPTDVLRPDRLFLNPAAMAWLGVRPGDRVTVQAGVREVALQVAGTVDLPGRPLAVMDIAGAQAAFGSLGRLSRIDLRLREGVGQDQAARDLASLLPVGARIELPTARARQAAEFTRAYRVNLDMLALVALFTGGLLVFSSQALAVVRRRRQLALLRTLGLTRRELVVLLLGEAAVLGVVGGILGVVLGQGLANLLLATTGADLGGAYFRGLNAHAALHLPAAAAFLGLGTLAAVLGSLAPVLEVAKASPARALRAGDEEELFARHRSPWPGLALVALGGAAAALPAVARLPFFGYAAIVLFLLAAITLLPWVAARLLDLADRLPLNGFAPAHLALAQLRAAAGQVSLALAPLVASVAVAAAMAIMVGSFRHSLEDWLDRLLSADIYLRTGTIGDSAFLPADAQARLAALAGVARIEFRRSLNLSLDPERPPVALLARRVDPRAAERTLPLVGDGRQPDPGRIPVWISEAMQDTYGWQPGQVVELPLGNRPLPVQVAGVWRDYVRSGGSIVINRDDYAAASGDAAANEAAVWVGPGAAESRVAGEMTGLFPAGLVVAEFPGDLKRLSLAIFDRTFAATYALEAAAVAVGLAGLSASFAALVLARRREFGVLRHIGMDRRQVAAMLACQGGLLAGVALAVGLVLGGVLSLVLVHVVNRQSFHWSMDILVPWGPLALFAGSVAGLAVLTAAVSGRLAMRREAALAVREDW
ncbi:MAG TPA: ABC transporter permease [Rhodocyclaceae bacterium]|nr:ABC transporter permease [Rhodocyclaceae bacterium]